MDGVWEVVMQGDCLLGLFECKRTRRLGRETFRQSERLRVAKRQSLWYESSYKSRSMTHTRGGDGSSLTCLLSICNVRQ